MEKARRDTREDDLKCIKAAKERQKAYFLQEKA